MFSWHFRESAEECEFIYSKLHFYDALLNTYTIPNNAVPQ